MRRLVHRKGRRARHQPVGRVKMPISKGDTVIVVSGAHTGNQARVLQVHPKTGRVTLEGVNLVKKHIRAQSATGESGIIEKPAPIHHSNVMLIDPKSGEPTRVRRRKDKDGTVERIAVKSGQSIPRNR